MKLSFIKIVAFFLIKYSILGIVSIIENVGVVFFKDDFFNSILYLILCFVMPLGVPITLIFSFLFFLINKLKVRFYLVFSYLIVFVLEFFMYKFLSSKLTLLITILIFTFNLCFFGYNYYRVYFLKSNV